MAAVADLLQALRVGAAQDAVVERLSAITITTGRWSQAIAAALIQGSAANTGRASMRGVMQRYVGQGSVAADHHAADEAGYAAMIESPGGAARSAWARTSTIPSKRRAIG